MTGYGMKMLGGCHCGALRYTLEWPADAGGIPARRCTCSYCTRFNGTWTSHPDARLSIAMDKEIPPGRYRFGTETADFLFCGSCGVTVAALCETGEGLKAVLNVNSLDAGQEVEFDCSDSDFEGESAEQRLARRTGRWIGQVRIN